MRPPCYGEYDAHRSAPCGGCAWRGPCASHVGLRGGFAFLHHPRYAPPTVATVARVATVADSGPFWGRLAAAGVVGRGGWVKWRGRPVARLGEAVPGRWVVEFADLPPATVASLPAAAVADVHLRPITTCSGSKRRDRVKTLGDVLRRRSQAVGCLAVLATAEDAADLVIDALKHCYT